MNVEIRNVEFNNKGAELMLHSIIQKMKDFSGDYKLALKPNLNSCPYEKFSKLGIYSKQLPIQRMGFHFGDLMSCIPSYLRDLYGIVLDKEIQVVLDASGFAYGDPFGVEPAKNLLIASRRWKKQKTKLILLPQAFGPFTSKKICSCMSQVIENSELIFARDTVSYENLKSLAPDSTNVKLAPDFTNLVQSKEVQNAENFDGCFCVIPNVQMIRKLDGKESLKYIPFMAKCLRYLNASKRNPYILIHESKVDLELAQEIISIAGCPVNIIEEADPLKIKEIIRLSDGLLASRFHGLVSALSQGIPALGTGWSHKYQMLFNDYNFPEGLLPLDSVDSHIFKSLDITSKHRNNELVDSLCRESKELKLKSESMWKAVFSHFV